ADLTKIAQRMVANAEHDVTWIERDDRGRRAVVIAPLSVAGTLSTHLFSERTVVATSATLALGGQFDTVARSLGLPVAAEQPSGPAATPAQRARETVVRADEARDTAGLAWQSLDVGPPFDYAKQGL